MSIAHRLTKELPLGIQFVAFVGNWLWWLGLLIWVLYRASQYAELQLRFASPFAVYIHVWFLMPLTLGVWGILNVRRWRPACEKSLLRMFCWRTLHILTSATVVTAIIGGAILATGYLSGIQAIRD